MQFFSITDRFKHTAGSAAQLKTAVTTGTIFKFNTHENALWTCLLRWSQRSTLLEAELVLSEEAVLVVSYFNRQARQLFLLAFWASFTGLAAVVLLNYFNLSMHPDIQLMLIAYPILVLAGFLVLRWMLSMKRADLILELKRKKLVA